MIASTLARSCAGPAKRQIRLAFGLFFGAIHPALAIPSPELVVGSLSSISQLVALVSAAFGGAAVVGFGARSQRVRAAKGSRLMLFIAFGALALLTISAGLNIYQYLDQKTERLQRLQATLVRPSRDAGTPVLDPTLKELTYAQQLRHPRGISTDEVQTLLDEVESGKRDDVVLIDVRETAETAMGTLSRSTVVRWPDLGKAKFDLQGKKPIIFCHNGDRSHETCEALAAQGIDCRFMVGGLEKWVVESRRMTGLQQRTIDNLRAIPDYRNHATLLDTKEVKDLLENEKAIFVDVRYPGEFAARHLSGAINLPIRVIATEELTRRIAELPRRPIIIPCYDRRSCFFSEVLGLELDRAGHDVRGRYTVPWDYYAASARPPHVVEWQERAERSLWTRAGEQLAAVLSWIADRAGFLTALILLALVSRLLVLPFSLKAERDQIKTRLLADEYKALKTRLEGDARLTRAMRGFYRRHGITPVRNLVALLFLPLFALSITAVQIAAAEQSGGFLWLRSMAERDSWLVMPALFSVLICVYLDWALVRRPLHRVFAWTLCFPLLTATGALFGAATNFYMIVSAVLLLAQRAAVDPAPARALIRRLKTDDGVVPLGEPDRLVDAGNKAYRLARMKAHGMPVPDGVVLTPRFLASFAAASATERERMLDRLWQRLRAERIAVRSSGAAEDGARHSFAGVFDTVLNVTRADLEDAIATVRNSFDAARANGYGVQSLGGSVILQHMIEAEFAGVLFTRDPSAGGLALVELVKGTAEGLVAGTISPDAFRFGRLTGRPLGDARAPIALEPLLALGREAEAMFGASQDIEWTYRDGRFLLVQSRDITQLAQDHTTATLESERARTLDRARGAAPDETVLEQNELSEMLPRPTPLSLSLMESLWASGGSLDLACRQLGLAYKVDEDSPSFLVTVFGRLYVDKREERARGPKLGPLAFRRLAKGALRIEREFRDDFLPEFERKITLLEAVDFDRLPTRDLVQRLQRVRDNFVGGTHVETEIINIAARFHLDRARAMLEKEGLDPAICLARIPEPAPARALSEAARLSGPAKRAALAAGYGHRSVLDYELAEPRYGERPEMLDGLASMSAPILHGASPDDGLAGAAPALKSMVETARRFQALKEDAKHYSLRELAVLRRIVVALDRRLKLTGLAFWLTLDELIVLADEPNGGLIGRAEKRKADASLFATVPPLPAALTPALLETVSLTRPEQHADKGLLKGTRVSGSEVVEGRARCIAPLDAERGSEIPDFRDGDVIVASMIHGAWLPYLQRAGGLVCEIGGWLSHMAIVARERNLPMIVGVKHLANIPDGSFLRLNRDGSIEVVAGAEGVRAAAIAAE